MLKLYLLVMVLFLSAYSSATVTLPVIFQNNMVLQRNKPCNIWGWAKKHEKIQVTFNNSSYQSIAAADGKWLVTLPPQNAGGPFNIRILGQNTVEIKNVLFGDVWICGGQSNMQFQINALGYKPENILSSSAQNIRLFTATIGSDFVPQQDLRGGKWEVADSVSVKTFSAAGYFFGKFLEENLNVPIGLISDNLGATSVETWMSREGISQFSQFDEFYRKYLSPKKSLADINNDFAKIKPDWEKDYYLKDDPGLEAHWYHPATDFSTWQEMSLPCYWEENGLPDFDGSVWFEKKFDLPVNFNEKNYLINLGKADDYCMAWVNGHKIGESYGNQNTASFLVADSLLKEKGNELVVRVFDVGGLGGLYNMFWDRTFSGLWKYKPGRKIIASEFLKPLVANSDIFSTPSNLFNANIAPLTDLTIKGFIWYQGESNADRAMEYQSLFPAFIKDWRNQFKQGDLPFLYVQLASFKKEPLMPEESKWAELREAQTKALYLPNTGMATAIDIGDPLDIHPTNKHDVGKRLGLAALKVAYGVNSVQLSPIYKNVTFSGDSILLHFEKEQQIITKDKYGYIRGFAIAGADKVFHWAKALIRNNSVIVYHPLLNSPVAVRYAWADNPGTIDLYNAQGQPVLPFRTDNWKEITNDVYFKLNP